MSQKRSPLHTGILIALIMTLAMSGISDAAQNGLPNPVVGDGFGVNIHFTHFAPNELKLFKDAGFGYARMDFYWAVIEKQKGVYDFSEYDTLVGDLDKANARALLILDYENPLYDNCMSPHSPEAQKAFAAFAGAAATHFKGRGVIWEIWNEPNISFWKPKPNVDDYGSLVKVTAAEIRRVDPQATILAGATSLMPQDYIESLLRSGALKDVTALSVHPYRQNNPETAGADFARVRALIARYTNKGKIPLPIVASEWGYTTATNNVSEQQQASYMIREYLTDLMNGVNMTTFYDWKDDGPNPDYSESRYGTLTQDLTPKPSYLAAKSFIQSLAGYSFSHGLKTDNPSQYKLLFSRGQDVATVSWTSVPTNGQYSLPQITFVNWGDSDYWRLEHASSVQWTPDVRTATKSDLLEITATVTNPDSITAVVQIRGGHKALQVNLKPHETRQISIPIYMTPDGPTLQKFELAIVWNKKPIDIIEPIEVQREASLDVQVAPTAKGIDVRLTNPLDEDFDGAIRIAGHDKNDGQTYSVSLPARQSADFVLKMPLVYPVNVDVVAKDGNSWAQVNGSNFLVDQDWLGTPPVATFQEQLWVQNAPKSLSNLTTVPCSTDAPADSAMNIPYDTSPGWQYYTINPVKDAPIPAGVKSLTFWIFGDSSGVKLTNRFMDSTGQVFQPNQIAVDWKGWRSVDLPVDGSNSIHWGGANDGVIHVPTKWLAYILIDSSGLPKQNGNLLMAAPSYRLN